MSESEKIAVDNTFEFYFKKMDDRHRNTMKVVYGLLSILAVLIATYIFTLGDVKANASTAKEGVEEVRQELKNKVDETEFSALRGDMGTIKSDIGTIKGFIQEHTRTSK